MPLEHGARAGAPPRRPPRKRKAGDGARATAGHHSEPLHPPTHHRPHGEAARKSPETAAQALAADSQFRQHDLDVRILAAIADLGFVQPTPIQSQSLPPALAGKDVAGQAQTGTGKTAAFLITILQRFLRHGGGARSSNAPMALVLAPTRELAIQIGEDARALAAHTGLRHCVVYGGMDYGKQKAKMAGGLDLLVATPGRLLDYMGQGVVKLDQVEILVIDEADRMLDMGFIPDVRRIISRVPPVERRQTLLFSATLSEAILSLASKWTRDPVRVEVSAEQVVAAEVEQVLYAVSGSEKFPLLVWLLQHEIGNRVLVFRNRRIHCDQLANRLRRHGVECEVMSGDVAQNKRLKVLDDFRSGRLRLIVATDVAGRGIHVDSVTHVVNYDMPYEAEDYVHRVGRTGRAGEKGKAIGFACDESAFILPEIETLINERLVVIQPTPEMLKIEHGTGSALHPEPPAASAERRHTGRPPGGRPGNRRGGSRGGQRSGPGRRPAR